MKRTVLLAVAATAASLLFAFGKPWAALAYHASTYRVTGAGETANVVVHDATVFASRAERGVDVVDVGSGKVLRTVPPPRGSESVDDLAIADGFLFVLDARAPGHLSVFSIADAAHPALVSAPVEVEVGPFSGVSAGGGRVIVSGGTSRMSLRAYDARGALSSVLATNDFGRGQPDVLLAADGKRAFVSTHYWGPYFGLTTVHVGGANALTQAATLDLDTYGFTDGGAKPASFPLKTALAGDALLVADREGLSVVSIADLAKPRVLAHLDLGVQAVNVDARGSLAAVIGSSPHPLLVLVDVANPRAPRVVRSIPLPEASYPTGVAIGATHVGVASHQSGVLLIPIS